MADSPRRRSTPRFSTGDAPSRAGAGRHARPATPSQSGRAVARQAGVSPRPSRMRASAPQAASVRTRAQRQAANPYAQVPRSGNTAGMQSLAAPRTRAQRQVASRGGHSHKGPIIAGVVAAVVVIAALVVLVPRLLMRDSASQDTLPNRGATVEVVIDDGSGAQAVAAKLKEAGVIASSDDFISELQRQKADGSLKSGAYVFTVGQDLDSIIHQLTTGPNSTSGRLSVPEGLTVSQTAALVNQTLPSISADDFVAQAKASNYAADYPFLAAAANDSLEGFLCPKTYDFSGRSDVTADTVIRAMLDQYQADVASLDFSAGEQLISERYGIQMSDYDILTLASIVEREAVTTDQRPKVSSVFFNRLKQGMALQSDATMMYVTGGGVTADDLKTESPYNTYLNTGLTPTPICAPSVESIKATLNPDDTNYLYFYITQTDEWFSATYDEHLQAIEENR